MAIQWLVHGSCVLNPSRSGISIASKQISHMCTCQVFGYPQKWILHGQFIVRHETYPYQTWSNWIISITPKPKLNKNGSLILTIVSVGCLAMGCLRIIQRSDNKAGIPPSRSLVTWAFPTIDHPIIKFLGVPITSHWSTRAMPGTSAGVRATPVLNRRRQESTMFSAGAKWMATFWSTNASPKI